MGARLYTAPSLEDVMIVVLDTETTSLPLFSDADHRDVGLWPRMVSVAWGTVSRGPAPPPTHFVLKPSGFSIPESSTRIHGITTEEAAERGVALADVFQSLKKSFGTAEPTEIVICCYNASFDRGVLLSEALRQKQDDMYQFLVSCQWQCVMKHATSLLNCGKYLKLVDCAKRLGIDTSSAVLHTANDDVTVTILILKKLGSLLVNHPSKKEP